MDQGTTFKDHGGSSMKKRRLKAPIDYILTITVMLQFMLLASEPTADQIALYIPVQTLNILTLILNLFILRKYGRLCNE